jgi:glutamine amidotransferase
MTTLILDYKMGNLHTLSMRLKDIGANYSVSDKPEDIVKADKLILPGVGHFARAMEQLTALNLLDALHEAVTIKQKPILGICLGMQLMASYSEEGEVSGLGWFDAKVKRMSPLNKTTFKIPHIGWNSIKAAKENPLLAGLDEEARYYFVHAYHLVAANREDILATTLYETPFASAIHREQMFGVQFHPEKSHDQGLKMIENFIKI